MMNSIEEEQDEEEDDQPESSCNHCSIFPSTASSSSSSSAAIQPAEHRMGAGCKDNDKTQQQVLINNEMVIRGVLFSRSIRSTYACLHLFPLFSEDEQENSSSSSGDEEEEDDNYDNDETELVPLLRSYATKMPLLVRLQFEDRNHESLSLLRSHIRRQFKMGDLLCIVLPATDVAPAEATTRNTNSTQPLITHVGQQQGRKEDRVILRISSILEATRHVRVEQYQYWKMGHVQQVQATHRQFLVGEASYHYKNKNNINQTNKKPKKSSTLRPSPCLNGHDDNSSEEQQHHARFADFSATPPEEEEEQNSHGGGCYSHHGGVGGALEKRKLALYIANFLVHMTINHIVEKTQRRRQQQQEELSSSSSSSCSAEEDYVGLDPLQWATTCPWQAAPHDLVRAAIEQLNSSKKTAVTTTTKVAVANEQEEPSNSNDKGTTTTTSTSTDEDSCGTGGGVLDVAGGSGLVSMALGLLFGVRSTVVDPR
jgi:hypothetical protein